MDASMKKQWKELENLKSQQELHRKQLEENRQKALAKRREGRHLSVLGQMVDELLPDKTEAEIRVLLSRALAPYQDSPSDTDTTI